MFSGLTLIKNYKKIYKDIILVYREEDTQIEHAAQ